VQQDQIRLRDLGQQRLLPQTHLNYLTKLRDTGVVPHVVYDIGACVLHWTNEARQLWPSAEFIAFEAMDASEFLYQEQNLRYSMGVLSNVDGAKVDFYQNNYHPGGNSYYKENEQVNPQAPLYFNESHRRRLETITLDTAVQRNNFPLPDMIKMDVQGAELDVLKGAVETLKSVKHIILELQVVEYNKGAPLFDIVVDYMDKQGFDCLGIFSNAGPDGDYHFCRRD
jgi:FkbM family methyltransferase